MKRPFHRELATFKSELQCLLATNRGEFVVIHEDRVIGLSADEDQAFSLGYRECGNVAFLVQRVLDEQEEVVIASNLVEPPTA